MLPNAIYESVLKLYTEVLVCILIPEFPDVEHFPI